MTIEAGKPLRVVMVVQPHSVEYLAEGMDYLYLLGVRQFDPSLNLWTTWSVADGERLKRSLQHVADFWGDHLPDCSVSWFDERAARIAGVPLGQTARCGFGHIEIAVTPAGNLYPCERLIGGDREGNPMRLPGHVLEGDDFLSYYPVSAELPAECEPCVLRSLCSTRWCHCSNFIRTGDVNRPDALLCLLDQTCCRETVRALESRALITPGAI